MSGLKDLSGKVAVVTGGASGIGRGIATRLVEQGMSVVIADIEAEVLERTAAEIGAFPIQTDVSDAGSVARLAQETIARFGAVHLVCNNAGVGSTGRIADLALEDWRWMIDVNLWGVIHGTHVFLPLLLANPEGGHFVNTASIGGLVTMPALGSYAVTKFGVVALSETLAQELAEQGANVGVTILCPGTVRTNIGRSARNRPAGLEGGLVDVDLEQTEFGALTRWMDPLDVGDKVVHAVVRGDLYALTHPEMTPPILQRHARIADAIQAATEHV